MVKDLTKEAINYIKKTKCLFNIKLVSTYRDGGTIYIECTNDKAFYGDKDKKTLHTSYPTTIDNRIFDPGLLDYLAERLHTFLVYEKKGIEILEHIINNKLNLEKDE